MYSVSKFDKRSITADEEVLLTGLPIATNSQIQAFSDTTVGYESANTNNKGQYNYCEDDGGWTNTVITPTGTNAHLDNDVFGYRAETNGSYFFISSRNDYDATGGNFLNDAGAIFVFENVAGTITQQQKLVSDSRVADRLFGNIIAYNGQDLVVADGTDVKVYNNGGSGDFTLFQTITPGGTCSHLSITSSRLAITIGGLDVKTYLRLGTWSLETGPDNSASMTSAIGMSNTNLITHSTTTSTKYSFDRDANSFDFEFNFNISQGQLPQIIDGVTINWIDFGWVKVSDDVTYYLNVFSVNNFSTQGQYIPTYQIAVWKRAGLDYVFDYSFSNDFFLCDITNSGNTYFIIEDGTDMTLLRRNKLVVT